MDGNQYFNSEDTGKQNYQNSLVSARFRINPLTLTFGCKDTQKKYNKYSAISTAKFTRPMFILLTLHFSFVGVYETCFVYAEYPERRMISNYAMAVALFMFIAGFTFFPSFYKRTQFYVSLLTYIALNIALCREMLHLDISDGMFYANLFNLGMIQLGIPMICGLTLDVPFLFAMIVQMGSTSVAAFKAWQLTQESFPNYKFAAYVCTKICVGSMCSMAGFWIVAYFFRKSFTVSVLLNEAELESKTAEEIQKSKSVYIAQVAHSFDTPFTTINFAIQFIKQTKLSLVQKNAVQTLESAAELMTVTQKEALDQEKYTKGLELTPDIQETSLGEIFRKCEQIMKYYSGAGHVPISFSIAPNVPKYFCTDPDFLWSMLMSYLSNARKYSASGQINLVAFMMTKEGKSPMATTLGSTRNMLSDDPYPTFSSVQNEEQKIIRIEVADEGRGIPMDKVQNLFKPFSQLNSGDEGIGLGLHSIYLKAKSLGGSSGVRQNNIDKRGSVFWFEVPCLPSSKHPSVSEAPELESKARLCLHPQVKQALPKSIIQVLHSMYRISQLDRIGSNFKDSAAAAIEILILPETTQMKILPQKNSSKNTAMNKRSRKSKVVAPVSDTSRNVKLAPTSDFQGYDEEIGEKLADLKAMFPRAQLPILIIWSGDGKISPCFNLEALRSAELDCGCKLLFGALVSHDVLHLCTRYVSIYTSDKKSHHSSSDSQLVEDDSMNETWSGDLDSQVSLHAKNFRKQNQKAPPIKKDANGTSVLWISHDFQELSLVCLLKYFQNDSSWLVHEISSSDDSLMSSLQNKSFQVILVPLSGYMFKRKYLQYILSFRAWEAGQIRSKKRSSKQLLIAIVSTTHENTKKDEALLKFGFDYVCSNSGSYDQLIKKIKPMILKELKSNYTTSLFMSRSSELSTIEEEASLMESVSCTNDLLFLNNDNMKESLSVPEKNLCERLFVRKPEQGSQLTSSTRSSVQTSLQQDEFEIVSYRSLTSSSESSRKSTDEIKDDFDSLNSPNSLEATSVNEKHTMIDFNGNQDSERSWSTTTNNISECVESWEDKILFVGNQQSGLAHYEKMLKTHGFEVTITMNAVEALEMMKEKTYQSVIFDHHVPDLDGREFIKRFRFWEEGNSERKQRKQHVVMLVPFSQTKCHDEISETCLIDDIVTKPVAIPQLVDIISTHHNLI